MRRPRFRRAAPPLPDDPTVGSTAGPSERSIIDEVRPYTMTSEARILATIDAVDHVVRNAVPGALAECGVWRGGSVLAMIRRLQQHGCLDRDIYLYDTFEGMTPPSPVDVSSYEVPALETWSRAKALGQKAWGYLFEPETFGVDHVRTLLVGSGYPEQRLRFVVGAVADTIPAEAPGTLALLRLDTDWYESTRHELLHLYPRLSPSGVLLIDDYGHWDGCRRAVDEYFAAMSQAPLLARVDYSGRVAVKP